MHSSGIFPEPTFPQTNGVDGFQLLVIIPGPHLVCINFAAIEDEAMHEAAAIRHLRFDVINRSRLVYGPDIRNGQLVILKLLPVERVLQHDLHNRLGKLQMALRRLVYASVLPGDPNDFRKAESFAGRTPCRFIINPPKVVSNKLPQIVFQNGRLCEIDSFTDHNQAKTQKMP
jgi:hypothetical protein